MSKSFSQKYGGTGVSSQASERTVKRFAGGEIIERTRGSLAPVYFVRVGFYNVELPLNGPGVSKAERKFSRYMKFRESFENQSTPFSLWDPRSVGKMIKQKRAQEEAEVKHQQQEEKWRKELSPTYANTEEAQGFYN